MQTQVMPDVLAARNHVVPWLERAAPGSSPSRVSLTSFPFTIGRLAPADLLVNSSRVSREHAAIHSRDGRYFVQDRGSTNGTFVNGQRITDQEVELRDGDALVIADVEFTFGGTVPGSEQETTTQTLRATRVTQVDGLDLIRAVRRMHEVVTQRCLPARFAPIVRLSDGQTVAFEAPLGDDASHAPRALVEAECRLTLRLQQLRRLTAAEHALGLPHDSGLFVGIVPHELGAEELGESLLQLAQVVGQGRLVVELPDSAVSDAPMLLGLCEQLRAAGVGIAHVGFSAGGGQLRQRKEFAPDYLKLVGSLARELHQSGPRRRQIQDIVIAARDLGTKVIVADVRREEEADACRELECDLAVGEYFSEKERQHATGHGTSVCLI
jgi:EAL domain-containing protein (putative c-di-GMP-specific phosphodiesterase class I)